MADSFDYIRSGACFNHFVLPPSGMDKKGFEDGLEQIAIEKIGELEDRLSEIKRSLKHSTNWFFEFFYTYQFEQEKYYIEKWTGYWKRLVGVDRIPFRQSSITDGDIAKAKEFPITDLFQGQLRHAGGGNFVGLCPFHEEKTPSFHIYPNHYHCFGCQAHGDSIDYLMLTQNKDFNTAVSELYAK